MTALCSWFLRRRQLCIPCKRIQSESRSPRLRPFQTQDNSKANLHGAFSLLPLFQAPLKQLSGPAFGFEPSLAGWWAGESNRLQKLNPAFPARPARQLEATPQPALTLAEQASPVWLHPPASRRWKLPSQRAPVGNCYLMMFLFFLKVLFGCLYLLSRWETLSPVIRVALKALISKRRNRSCGKYCQ